MQWPIAIFFVALSCSIYYCGPDLKERRRWHWFTPGAAFGGFALIKEYADSYDHLSDEQAKSLTDRNLALEKKRVALREDYFNKFSKPDVSPKTAARFMQVDYRIDLLLNVQLASAIPMVEK